MADFRTLSRAQLADIRTTQAVPGADKTPAWLVAQASASLTSARP